MTRELLWARLREAGVAEGEAPAPDPNRSPWYVRTMLGIAGWIGAFFLLGFVGLGFVFVMKSALASFAVGAVICGAAALLLRLPRQNDVLTQFALVVSLAGQALMAFGVLEAMKHSTTAAALAIAGLQAVLFLVVPNFIHRVWTSWSGAAALVIALAKAGLGLYAPALLAAGFALVWLREFDHARRGELVRAGGYGLCLAIVQTLFLGSLDEMTAWIGFREARAPAGGIDNWLATGTAGAVLVGTVAALLRREAVDLGSGVARAALAGTLILAAVTLKAPGVAPAALILLLGYANGNRVLVGAGVAALLGYLSYYYYSLQATLLEKSMLLAAAGFALLVARLALQRWWPAGHPNDA